MDANASLIRCCSYRLPQTFDAPREPRAANLNASTFLSTYGLGLLLGEWFNCLALCKDQSQLDPCSQCPLRAVIASTAWRFLRYLYNHWRDEDLSCWDAEGARQQWFALIALIADQRGKCSHLKGSKGGNVSNPYVNFLNEAPCPQAHFRGPGPSYRAEKSKQV